MDINGINLDDLDDISTGLMPKIVPGRVLQLDGDCLAYECSGDDDDPFNMCKTNWRAALANRMAMVGAERCIIHLTGGDKGGRYDIAMVKEYQANRKDKVKPKNLAPLKAWVQDTYKSGTIVARNHQHQEADDGMAQEQFQYVKAGKRNLSVIMTMDKDLGMCSGLHADWHTYIIEDVDGFGSIYLDESGSSKKIKGFGTSFFFAQLLMGDTADNIPGLPKVGMPLLDEVDPLKNPRKADANPKLCGAVMAWKILENCKTDKEALLTVIKAYQSYYGTVPFDYKTWRGDTIRVTSGHMILEQAKLLWMRRVVDECPSVFFKQIIEGVKWDGTRI